MTTVLEKVRRLIALAASPEEEEARNAAVMACRLILEHGLVILEKGREGEAISSSSEPYDPTDIFQRIRRGEVGTKMVGKIPKAKGPPVRMKAKKGSLCRVCGDPYFKGEEIVWTKGFHSAIHVRCSGLGGSTGGQSDFGFGGR